jgi:hypothetical protein
MRRAVLLALLLLAACGRPLTPEEQSFATRIHGDSLDVSRIRLHDGALIGEASYPRPRRPRRTCRERLLPEPQGETVTVSPAAVVLYNRVFLARDWYADNFLPGYPERMSLTHAMLLAHEITHVWQWQNRDVTGYSPFRSFTEHTRSPDPYLFDVGTGADFLDYGYEQQASIVEEYVCCAALDPDAPRTRRMAAMLREAFPLGRLPIPERVILPWTGAETRGICR